MSISPIVPPTQPLLYLPPTLLSYHEDKQNLKKKRKLELSSLKNQMPIPLIQDRVGVGGGESGDDTAATDNHHHHHNKPRVLTEANLMQKILKSYTIIQCDECGAKQPFNFPHFLPWWSETGGGLQRLCQDCFAKEDKLARREKLGEQVKELWIKSGQTHCELCKSPCLDSITGKVLKKYHADHFDLWQKTDSLYTMLRRNDSLEHIERERQHCRLLCLNCHSLFTAAQHLSGSIAAKQNQTRQQHQRRRPQDITTMTEEEEEDNDNKKKQYEVDTFRYLSLLQNLCRK